MKSSFLPSPVGIGSHLRTDAVRRIRFGQFFPQIRNLGWFHRTLLILVAMGGLPIAGPMCGLNATIADDGPTLAARQFQPHVEIFRGLGGYMPGTGCLQGRLAARGITSTMWSDLSAHRVASRIVERRAQGDHGAIVLMGYATGGGAARRTAIYLAKHGICVDAIILLEPSFFEPVPSNVRTCFVAYKPEPLQMWNSLMRGNPVRVESQDTVVQRVNLKQCAPPGVLRGENHLTIASNPWVQSLLVEQAEMAFGLERVER